MRKPKHIWGVVANAYGLWQFKPRKYTYNADLNWWYNRATDTSIDRLGLIVKDGYFSYARTSKRDVTLFLQGVQQGLRLLQPLMQSVTD